MTDAEHPSRVKLLLMFSLMVSVWSLSFVVIRNAKQEIPPFVLAVLRAVGSTLVLIPVAWWDGRKHPHPRWNWADAPKLLLAATLGITINQVLFVLGVYRTSVAHAAIMMALNPASVYVLATMMGLEQPAVRRFVGMGIALAGVAMLQVAKDQGSVATLTGDLMVFTGSTAFAGYTVLGKSLTRRYGSVYVTTIGYAVGAATLLPIAWFSGEHIDLMQISWRAWASIAYLVLLHSVMCYLIFYYLLMHTSASRVSLFSYIQPVLASLFAWILLSESVTWPVVGGGLLVGAGVWLAERRA